MIQMTEKFFAIKEALVKLCAVYHVEVLVTKGTISVEIKGSLVYKGNETWEVVCIESASSMTFHTLDVAKICGVKIFLDTH